MGKLNENVKNILKKGKWLDEFSKKFEKYKENIKKF